MGADRCLHWRRYDSILIEEDGDGTEKSRFVAVHTGKHRRPDEHPIGGVGAACEGGNWVEDVFLS